MASHLRSGAVARAGIRQTRASANKSSLHNPRIASRLHNSRPASPAESLSSVAASATHGTKRKERDYETDNAGETNINVVVRCRGRNEREVREKSAVVVDTEGVKGTAVTLSMGPNAVSNKAYTFDSVFSPAADQSMLFDDVVKPILEEMLTGFNCTIFAYGQTGTGKTYTMSGDMNDTMGLLSDAAGIIPRVLQALFTKLEVENAEHDVKCSFIELYNEELRDLISPDEGGKLKIFDDTSRRGHSTTVVQGMVERHIHTAPGGIKVLQEGSLRRQVAATKCNDLSSRSHTVFTISVLIKRTAENGEDYLSHGKLNLVDLAGSENIQRSGAENKRAAEAGLINKSLLTLGRVINALVDRSAHIPYRESKLTRLLQDSLGGRTKTCIIATISPARSNLEETISTLDYAFRAKNIRNKPQINQMVNRNKLLTDFTQEIEKLRSELIATRQRNGVYLSNDAYEEMTVESESRRILTEEQSAKIETLESNLRNKVQELHSLTSSFMGVRKEADSTKAHLDQTLGVLDQTELVLAATKKCLREETHIRKAHEETEGKLVEMGGELISTLHKTVNDIGGLHAKNKRKSDLQCLNRKTWGMSQAHVAEVTQMLEDRVHELRKEQQSHITNISGRMQSFVQEEIAKLSSTQQFLDEKLEVFAQSKHDLIEQRDRSKEEMDEVLEEIKEIRDHVKQKVGTSLQAIAGAAEKIAEDVLSELSTFHGQLHASYNNLGKDFKSLFDELLGHISHQRGESDALRRELQGASQAMVESNVAVSTRLQEVVQEERRQAAEDRQKLVKQITTLINTQAQHQESRLAERASELQQSVISSNTTFQDSVDQYSQGMDGWVSREEGFVQEATACREAFRGRIKDDWASAKNHSTSIQKTTKSVHKETVNVVDEQMKDLDVQMEALDDFVTRARSQNSSHNEQHAATLQGLSETVESSNDSIGAHFQSTFGRIKDLGGEMDEAATEFQESLAPMDEKLCQPLADLREEIGNTILQEYNHTGSTPERVQYQYPITLPQTEAHENILANMKDTPTPNKTPAVYSDADMSTYQRSPSRPPSSGLDTTVLGGGSRKSVLGDRLSLGLGLREVNPNVTTGSLSFDPRASTMSLATVKEKDNTAPLMMKQRSVSATVGSMKATKSGRKGSSIVTFDGRENVPPSAFGNSIGVGNRRKSPRLN
ncbi:kinesin motor domain-containing protein [Zalerion maritima]|uniref:Kinesin motor domain-containing protein n=1 Tax=Zalerion maritima TaxID=339359 RepID=A0AAD5RSA9_9PEZI|nr:kinesin motor domain-containing protein [Zalerion maritima]